jgi:hypothetical protein
VLIPPPNPNRNSDAPEVGTATSDANTATEMAIRARMINRNVATRPELLSGRDTGLPNQPLEESASPLTQQTASQLHAAATVESL